MTWAKTGNIKGPAGTQVNADWNAASGVAQILNRPTLGTAAAQDSTAFAPASTTTTANNAMPKTGGTFSGAVVTPSFSVNGAATSYPGIAWEDSGVVRWSWNLFPDDTFQLVRYDASGVNQGSALVFNTSNGGLTCSGGLTGTNVWANATLYRSPANDPTTPIAQPRIFVQPGDPGNAAADGDLWAW